MSKQVTLFLLILFLAAGSARSQADGRKVRVLIVNGQNNHGWVQTSAACRTILERTGRFEVATSTSPPRSSPKEAWTTWRPQFADHDVVLSDYNGERWPEAVRKDLESFVKGGGGLVTVHAADNAFAGWPAWNLMIGVGGWGGRNERSGPMIRWREGKMFLDGRPGRGGSHGRQHPFAVKSRTSDHPIMKGLPAVWMHAKDELYDRLRGPAENVTVLATAFSDTATGGTGEDEPVLMAIDYGKGRVFHTTLGHHGGGQKRFVSLACVGFATTLARGTEWTATGAVDPAGTGRFPRRQDRAAFRPLGPPSPRRDRRRLETRRPAGFR